MRLRLGASGAEKVCALGAIRRLRAVPKLHRYVALAMSAV